MACPCVTPTDSTWLWLTTVMVLTTPAFRVLHTVAMETSLVCQQTDRRLQPSQPHALHLDQHQFHNLIPSRSAIDL
ncbi:hypothetical protein V1520DRAFT_3089 [Lipomyces starkeyi]